jgi:YD repeat-containing protein
VNVERWVPVSLRFTGHRPEPLLRERVWGNDDPLPADVLERSKWWGEAGYDTDGRAIAFRSHGEEGLEHIEFVDGAVVVHLLEGGTATTEFDDAGRPVRTRYVDVEGDDGEERYEYDADGRLVVIQEFESLLATVPGNERWYGDGRRLTVEHDDRGPVRIVDADGAVGWARPARPLEEELAAFADVLAAEYREVLPRALEEDGVEPGAAVYGLTLVYFGQGDLLPVLTFGLEADRAGLDADEAGAITTLYTEELMFTPERLSVPREAERAMLRTAAIAQPDDPLRVVLGEVARRLSDGELPGLTKTDDFVAWVAEHDEGLAEKIVSIRLHNSPEAVARWEAGWGGKVLPFSSD